MRIEKQLWGVRITNGEAVFENNDMYFISNPNRSSDDAEEFDKINGKRIQVEGRLAAALVHDAGLFKSFNLLIVVEDITLSPLANQKEKSEWEPANNK